MILSDYRLDRVLGHGGFGITYLATDLSLDQRVAIKEYYPREFAVRDSTMTVLPTGSSEDRDNFSWGLERFREEARTLARFSHPNIIAVRRLFEANGTSYIVMDFCEGEPLDALIRREAPLSAGLLEGLFTALLDGLEQVHAAGVMHRDIKPANIFIRADGIPVLLDFGAARQALVSHSRSMTSLATAHYAAFEQYSTRGNQGAWTDIYGLAATLYHAATGEKPLDAPDRILEDKLVSLSIRAAGQYPRGLLQAIDAGLEVRPESRPQTVAQWRRLMEPGAAPASAPIREHGSQRDAHAPSANVQKSRRAALGAIVGIFLLLFLILAFVVLRRPTSPEVIGEAAAGQDQSAQVEAPDIPPSVTSEEVRLSDLGQGDLKLTKGDVYRVVGRVRNIAADPDGSASITFTGLILKVAKGDSMALVKQIKPDTFVEADCIWKGVDTGIFPEMTGCTNLAFPQTLSAEEYEAVYAENVFSADEKLKDRPLIIFGTVRLVAKLTNGDDYVSLEAQPGFSDVTAIVAPSNRTMIRSYAKPDNLAVMYCRGGYRYNQVGSLGVNACRFLQNY